MKRLVLNFAMVSCQWLRKNYDRWVWIFVVILGTVSSLCLMKQLNAEINPSNLSGIIVAAEMQPVGQKTNPVLDLFEERQGMLVSIRFPATAQVATFASSALDEKSQCVVRTSNGNQEVGVQPTRESSIGWIRGDSFLGAKSAFSIRVIRPELFSILHSWGEDWSDDEDLIVVCHTKTKPQELTFAKRRLQMRYGHLQQYLGENDIPIFKYDLLVDFAGIAARNEVRVSGGKSGTSLDSDMRMDEVRQMDSQTDDLELDWTDDQRAMTRDAWLIVIGALLGAVGAAFIEWMKALIPSRRT